MDCKWTEKLNRERRYFRAHSICAGKALDSECLTYFSHVSNISRHFSYFSILSAFELGSRMKDGIEPGMGNLHLVFANID